MSSLENDDRGVAPRTAYARGTRTIVAMALWLGATGCIEPAELDEGPQDVRLEDAVIDDALGAVMAGDDTASAVSSDETAALSRLRANPHRALRTWRRSLAADASPHRQAGLVFLVADLCLAEAIGDLADVAERDLPPKQTDARHGEVRMRQRAIRVQAHAVRGIGRLSSSSCDALSVVPAAERRAMALDLLEQWVFEAPELRLRHQAAEALLVHHPRRAARLRRDLAPSEDWLLTPFEDRRVEPVVHDDTPDTVALVAGGTVPMAKTVEAAAAASCPFSLRPTNETGDNFFYNVTRGYGLGTGETCTQLGERYANEAHFQRNTWDDGFGIDDPCDERRPFKRTVNALWILENSPETPSDDYSQGVIHWAYDYVKKQTRHHELEGSCEYSEVLGRTHCTSWWCRYVDPTSDMRIELLLRSFDEDVIGRAINILHEARHAGGYGHNSKSTCDSCDTSYSYRGANTLSVQWLAQYIRIGRFKIAWLGTAAQYHANEILRTRYRDCPNMQVSPSGWLVDAPGLCD